nr:HAD family acid phosphatase [Fulvimarina endophytica]
MRYQQSSAEVNALQYQAYNFATLRVDEAVEGIADPSSLAVVLDLDETVIDNTPLLVRDLRNCHRYDHWDTWRHWEREGHPSLISGAKAFLEHANETGIAIRYISDRTDDQLESTLATLNELKLPQVSAENVLLLGPSKPERRDFVSRNHEIVLLLGDTLHDFDMLFEIDSLTQRREVVAENRKQFGEKWIIFPNAAYGDWNESELDGWDAEPMFEDYETRRGVPAGIEHPCGRALTLVPTK